MLHWVLIPLFKENRCRLRLKIKAHQTDNGPLMYLQIFDHLIKALTQAKQLYLHTQIWTICLRLMKLSLKLGEKVHIPETLLWLDKRVLK